MYCGHVYIHNGDILSPIADVAVSDGRHVVRTDAKGQFVLKGYEKSKFIFITTPSGYTTVSWYHRITTENVSYDFYLQPYVLSAAAEHRFLHITDTEVGAGGAGGWADYLKTYITNEKPAFLIHTGDICYEAGLRSHILDINVNTMGCPVYYTTGNHDYIDDPAGGESLFEELYGPVWYSFDCGNVHYVVLPMENYVEFPSAYSKVDSYQWLMADLRAKDPNKGLIVFSHAIQDFTREPYVFAEGFPTVDLRDYGLLARAYGHYHNRSVRRCDGYVSISTSTPDKGGVDHSLMAFSEVHIQTDKSVSVSSRHFYVPRQVVITQPQSEVVINHSTSDSVLPITANGYYHGAKTTEMTAVLRAADGTTLYSEMKQRSDWTWQCGFDMHLINTGGEYSICVTAVFTDGTTVTATNNFTIAETDVQPVQPLMLKWVRHLEAAGLFCSPVWADGKLFVATCDDNGNGTSAVWALDPTNGTTIWKYSTRNSVKNVLGYEDGIVVVQDSEGYVYALDASEGSCRWKYRLPYDRPYACDGLTVHNGVVFCGLQGERCALDLQNGRVLWKGERLRHETHSCKRDVVIGDCLISGMQWDCLAAFDIRSGQRLWAQSEHGLRFRSMSPVSDPEDPTMMYIASVDTLHRIRVSTGEIIEKFIFPGYHFEVISKPCVCGDRVLLATSNCGLLAVSKSTGEVLWNFVPDISLICSSPYSHQPNKGINGDILIDEGRCLFGAEDGCIYVLDVQTGTVMQRYPLGAPVFASLSLEENRLAAMDCSGCLYVFDVV